MLPALVNPNGADPLTVTIFNFPQNTQKEDFSRIYLYILGQVLCPIRQHLEDVASIMSTFGLLLENFFKNDHNP